MGHKDPAIDFTDVLPAKGVGGDSHRWRHRGEPVEAVNYGEHKQTLEVLNKRQDEKRQTAQRIDHSQPLARLNPVDHPTGQHGSDKIQPAHYADQRRCRHLRNPMVNFVRNEMGTDQAIRGSAANEKTSGE